MSYRLAASWSMVVTLLCLPVLGQDTDYRLTLTDVCGVPGSTAEMSVMVDNTNGGDLQGWSYGVLLADGIETLGVELGEASAALNGGNGPSFHQVLIFADGYAVGAVVSMLGIDYISPGNNELEVVTLR